MSHNNQNPFPRSISFSVPGEEDQTPPHFAPGYSVAASPRTPSRRQPPMMTGSPTEMDEEDNQPRRSFLPSPAEPYLTNVEQAEHHGYFAEGASPSHAAQARPMQARVEHIDDDDAARTEESFPMRSQRNTIMSQHTVNPFEAQDSPGPMAQVHRWPSSRPGIATSQSDARLVSAPLPEFPPATRQLPQTPGMPISPRPVQASGGLPSYHSGRDVSRSMSSSGMYMLNRAQQSQERTPQQSYQQPSPAMMHSYSMPRLSSAASTVNGTSLKPILLRNHTGSSDTLNCELGMMDYDEKTGSRRPSTQLPQTPQPRSGFGAALSGMYDRMVSATAAPAGPVAPQQPRQMSGSHQQSMAYVLGEHDEPMEPDDPRITGAGRKSAEFRRQATEARSASGSFGADGKPHLKPRSRAMSLAHTMDTVKNAPFLNGSLCAAPKLKRFHSSVKSDVEDRRKFVLKMARALMLFGAPSHRVESQLNALAGILDVKAQFIHFPGIVIASFGDCESHNSSCRFVKSKTAIALGRLTELHVIYKDIMSDNLAMADAGRKLDTLLKAPAEWSNLSRILFSMVKCGMMAPINFGGSFVDIWISMAFGGLLTFSQLCLAGGNDMFSNVFDIAVAILFSFLARLLSAKSVFCYEAVASSGLIGLLPGYAILCASLELASKNMMTGSVRMVYAIIYSLFLGFSIAIGSELYYWVDPKARHDTMEVLVAQTEIVGSFLLENATTPYWNGTFSFTNGTAKSTSLGEIGCMRMDDWPWWRQPVPAISHVATVPVFALLSCLSFLHPLFSRETPVSVIIACIGYAANGLANKYIFDRSDVVSAIGSFVIGLLGNAYSRIWNATAFTAITVAVNFLVPSGLAMAGGLAMTHKGSDGDLYSNGLSLGFRMVQVSIGITTGLFVSALLVHMIGNKRSNAVLFAF